MAYATQGDVEALMAKFSVSATSKPTETQVTAFVDQISNVIDTCLAASGVAVPVTTPAYFMDFLLETNAYGAVAETLKSMFPDAAGAGETPAYSFWERRFTSNLNGIKNGSLIPPGLAASEARPGPSTYFTRNPDVEEKVGDIAEPLITRDQVF